MKHFFCLLTIVFTAAATGNELAIGKNNAGNFADTCLKQGVVRSVKEGERKVAQIRAFGGFTRMTIPMPAYMLGKCYMLRVTAKSNTSDAQIMLTEGFLWGSGQKVKRFIRKRIAGDNEYADYEIPFKVEALPFYINFGILYDKKGEMRVSDLLLREISEREFTERERRTAEFPRDRSRKELFEEAKARLLKTLSAAETNKKLPPEIRKYAGELHGKIRTLAISGGDQASASADRVISDAEKIVIAAGGKRNPEKLEARNGSVRIRLFQLHADHSVWARLEADDPQLEYRVVAPDGNRYLLNQADAVCLPAGEGVELEVSNVKTSATLHLFPLDHFGSDVWRTLRMEKK